ncbi:3-isopropylmalate dehydratase large subunit [Methanorbis rubei]|uniref:3-isopropylmalate dehydratase large subunit n=1 Tax=Methanorbis rubei TaxID=3028300 RepID=A0AAE4MG83_9EURY|nr:3-isopropylmalate dehydratase large subunit [Methanocorpusculaceae archaeon Cs1]
MHRTIAEKILQSKTDQKITGPGQIVRCKLSLVLANDITAPLAIKSFREMGANKVFDKDKVVFVCDHFTPNKDIDSAEQVSVTRSFAQEMGITHYYEGGNCGIEHALLPEEGLVGPWDLVIGADSHTCTYGGIGAFSTGMGSTDIAAGMVLGENWFKVPPSIKVDLHGKMGKYVQGKDVILKLIGTIGVSGALYKALEFGGSGVDKMSIESRLTIANMAIEAGAKAGLFPADKKTLKYTRKAGRSDEEIKPDKFAMYESEIDMEIKGMAPQVALPHLPENVKGVDEVGELEIHQAVIGSCTNGRIEDMRQAADILRGRKVDKHVRCIIIPATPRVWSDCVHEGLMQVFIDAGAIISPPTCGPCLGGHMGILAKGERAISTTNRNFRGRMGSLDSEVILSNPAVAAASAVTGRVTDPRSL